ncbi:MAG: cobyric acid synthase CobQ, partial [Dehalococcoidia bacterium]|nr:cobyric acid synthase CobQ [Dehalococcoidia bacterium]
SLPGLGLLDIDTVFHPVKRTVQVRAHVIPETGLFAGLAGMEVCGYEIHMGRSSTASRPLFRVLAVPGDGNEYDDGSINSSGLVFGTYIHGLFNNRAFTGRFLDNLRRLRKPGAVIFDADVPGDRYDRLARLVKENVDMVRIYDFIFRRR